MRKKKNAALLPACAALSMALFVAGTSTATAAEMSDGAELPADTMEEVVDEEKEFWFSWNDSNFKYVADSKDETTCVIEEYLGSAGEVVVPTTVNARKITGINSSTFRDKDQVTSVTIPDGFTTLNNSTFEGCDALTTVNLPSTLTSIGNKVFYNCPSLTKIVIPEGVTSIGEYTFANCSSLKEVVIPSTVTMISYKAFSGCTSLEKVVLPESVKVIAEYAFADCTSLKEINIPAGVTTIKNNAFENCAALTEVTVPETVTTFGDNVFNGCIGLKTLNLKAKIKTAPVMNYTGMASLETLVLPDEVTEIPRNYFRDATTIKSITFSKNLTTIGSEAFYGCTSLESINLPDGLKEIKANTFYGCANLASINIPNTVTSIGNSAFAQSGLTAVTVPESVMTMGGGVFQKCTKLKDATILAKGITELPASTFDECTSLVNISLPATITKICNYAFRNCSSLKEFTSPEGVTYILDNVFENCDSLTTVTLSKRLKSIGYFALGDCDNLTSVMVMNPECTLNKQALGEMTTTIIYGYKDSSAQKYAEKYKMTFCDIEEKERRDQVSAFASRMYTVVLNRAADNKGMTDWTNWLLDHTVDGAGIAEGFFLSDEFVKKNVSNEEYVNILYRTFFDREADVAGKETWMGLLAEGKSRKSVLAGFVNSVEFDTLCTSYGIVRGTMVEGDEGETTRTGVDGFVERLYSKVLKRNPDPEGMSTWKNLIVTGNMSAEDAAKSFFFSDEFIKRGLSDADYVDTLYQTFMGRGADEAGKTFWVQLLAGGMSRNEVLEGFSRSEEFKAILVSFGL